MRLTPREASVLRLVCEGLNNKQIASQLRIALSYVKHNVTALHRKLGVASRTQLIPAALLAGLYTLPGFTLQPIPWQETVR